MKAVHVAITRQVKPGCEAAFEEVLRVFARESLREPGTSGVHLIAPVPGDELCEYGILRSFVNDEARRRFYHSYLFKKWQEQIADLVVGEPVSGIRATEATSRYHATTAVGASHWWLE